MEVEQVGFDGEGIGPEGGTVADVGDCVKALGVVSAADANSRDVHAVLWNEFFVAGQVDGGDGVFGAIAASASSVGEDAEGAAQEVAGSAGVAFGEQFANVAAGNALSAQTHLRVVMDFKAHLVAELT